MWTSPDAGHLSLSLGGRGLEAGEPAPSLELPVACLSVHSSEDLEPVGPTFTMVLVTGAVLEVCQGWVL